jgi:hypothetical protein
MTHSPLPADERVDLGITDTLLRASVGVEHPKDLIADLERGFEAMASESADGNIDSETADSEATDSKAVDSEAAEASMD